MFITISCYNSLKIKEQVETIQMSAITPLSILVGLVISYILYQFLLSPIVLYCKLGFKLGFDKVAIIYRPFTSIMKLSLEGTQRYGRSDGEVLDIVKKNPMVKIIINKIVFGTTIFVTDIQLVRKLNHDYVKNIQKQKVIVFLDQINKGLIFQQGDQWKKSRGIISNVFHFDALKSRQSLMEKIVAEKIIGLQKGVDNLFHFGRSIGGEIVMKSLFGEQFFKTKINGKNAYEEIHQILYSILDESFTARNFARLLLGNKTNKHSLFMSSGQKLLLSRITNFKAIAMEYIVSQFQRYQRKQEVPPFLEAYFKLSDKSYFQQIIHQLFLFLFAAEDTTGAAIEMNLALLATYPEYQDKILEDVKSSSIQSSKQLSNFINEMMRMYSILTMSSPRIVTQTFTVEGITFEKDSQLMIIVGVNAVNPRFWQNPQEFNPKRFDKPIQNSLSLIPFSSGPRNCIGQHLALMEIKITIVRILQKYRLQKNGTSLSAFSGLNIIGHLVQSDYVRFCPKTQQ